MTLILDKMPDTGSNYLRAALSLRRRPGAGLEVPSLEAALNDLRIDAGQLAAYRDLCGFVQDDALPITFPQVVAAAMQMHLLNQPGFPVPLVGLVHLRNRIEQQRALKPDESFTVKVRIVGPGRSGDKGLEFDIVTEFLVGDSAVWQSTATVLRRAKVKAQKAGGKRPADPAAELAQYLSFDAPADIGRRYGRISGDLNPIHLSPLSARLFGYPRAIAHGMWSLARCAALLGPQLGRAPRALDCAFKQPLFLPGRVALRHRRDGDGIAFGLLSRNSDKLHLTGALR